MKARAITIWKNAFWESVELFLMMSTLLTGIPIFVDTAKYAPPSMVGLDPTLQKAWAGFILFGGMAACHGILVANLYTRRAGLMLVAGAAIALSFVLASSGDAFRLLGAVSYFLGGVALVARFIALKKLGDALDLATRVRRLGRP